MLDQERCRAPVEHVQGRAGARIDFEEPPVLAIDEAIGAGKTRQPGGAGEPQGRLRDPGDDEGRNRGRLGLAAGERPGIAERPQGRGRLPLFGEGQGLDPAAVGEEVEGEGAAGLPGLEVVAGRGGADRARADMRPAAAARALDQPRAPLGNRAGRDGRMRDREALAERGQAERVLERGHRLGARAEQAVAGGDRGDEVRRALEAAAEDDAEGATGPLRQFREPPQHAGPVADAGTEAAGQRAVRLGQSQGVFVAEQVEHERPQPRPPRGLGQRPTGQGGDQDRAALAMTQGTQWRARRRTQRRPQPAISTASL